MSTTQLCCVAHEALHIVAQSRSLAEIISCCSSFANAAEIGEAVDVPLWKRRQFREEIPLLINVDTETCVVQQHPWIRAQVPKFGTKAADSEDMYS